MKSNLLMDFSVDKTKNQIKVTREFAAPLNNVWAAWTQKELLDQWWAPKPWKAKTKIHDFKEVGLWLYAMLGPEGEEHWAKADFKSISALKSIVWKDAFCDENGKLNTELPGTLWEIKFSTAGDLTVVNINMTHEKLEDLEQIIAMGFKEGFTLGLENLDDLLAS